MLAPALQGLASQQRVLASSCYVAFCQDCSVPCLPGTACKLRRVDLVSCTLLPCPAGRHIHVAALLAPCCTSACPARPTCNNTFTFAVRLHLPRPSAGQPCTASIHLHVCTPAARPPRARLAPASTASWQCRCPGFTSALCDREQLAPACIAAAPARPQPQLSASHNRLASRIGMRPCLLQPMQLLEQVQVSVLCRICNAAAVLQVT